MYCPKCGFQNENGAAFCSKCGTSLNSMTRSNITGNVNKKNSSNSNLIILLSVAIGVCLIMAIIVVFIINVTSSKNNRTNLASNDSKTEILQEKEKEVEQTTSYVYEQTPTIPQQTPSVPVQTPIIPPQPPTPSVPNTNTNISNGSYILQYSNTTYLTESDLSMLTPEQLRIARNEIYARHGRRFNDASLQAYFDSCSWYRGTIAPNDFSESIFNEFEKYNKDFIRKYEQERGYN